MDDTTKVLLTTAVAVVLAFTGYWAKYRNDLGLAQQKERVDRGLAQQKESLDRVNRQLNELYGPLYAYLRSSTVVWEKFFHAHSPSPIAFFSDVAPTDQQKADYRLWISTVFMPMNTAMVDAFTKHADLLEDDEMPQCLLDLAAHVAAYQAVLKKWEANDFSIHTSLLNFPTAALEAYVIRRYQQLKTEQLRLLGQRKETLG